MAAHTLDMVLQVTLHKVSAFPVFEKDMEKKQMQL